MQDTIRYSVTIAILVISGFGIYNILNVLINQKKREIAILRSIGYESNDINLIFLIQGVILGLVGSILGMLVGYLICLKLSTLSFNSPYLSTKTGKMLISYDLKIYFQAFFLAIFSTLLASILPARSAGKLQPIEIIRGEL
jgi:lipoprotein-releasing system permease protein